MERSPVQSSDIKGWSCYWEIQPVEAPRVDTLRRTLGDSAGPILIGVAGHFRAGPKLADSVTKVDP